MYERPAAIEIAVNAALGRIGTLRCYPMEQDWSFSYDSAWLESPGSFAISPHIPLTNRAPPSSHTVSAFLSNLIPEGQGQYFVAELSQSKDDQSLLKALHYLHDTAGALEFGDVSTLDTSQVLTDAMLDTRLRCRELDGLTLWYGRLKMNLAGVQDKLAVRYTCGQELQLVPRPGASNAFIKPEPAGLPCLVANEHFCMALAKVFGFTMANVEIIRRYDLPLLLVHRFDRFVTSKGIHRIHIVDACQALDLEPSQKTERQVFGGEVLRDGATLPKMFGICDQAGSASGLMRLDLLRWVVFQLIIGNNEAHAKNYSYYVSKNGLSPAPWYDVLSTAVYPEKSAAFAMGINDAFNWDELTAYQLACFAKNCGVDVRAIYQEAKLLSALLPTMGCKQIADGGYLSHEVDLLKTILHQAHQRAKALTVLAEKAMLLPIYIM